MIKYSLWPKAVVFLTSAVAALSFLGAATSISFAEGDPMGTPDDLPPPLEDVCDMTSGAAHGLCTAYCEAMDCDSAIPNASDEACQNVSDAFEALEGSLPPCDTTCPCWDLLELQNVTADNQSLDFSCPGLAYPHQIQNVPGSTPGMEGGFGADAAGDFTNFPACLTRDFPPFVMEISIEDALECEAQIAERCAAIGSPIP